MSVIILAGPPAVGHNTIANLLGKLRPRLAVVDLDELRDMMLSPPTESENDPEWQRQYELAIRHACMLVCSFDREGYDVVLVDVAPPETLPLYRAGLASLPQTPRIVLLMADLDTLIRRDIVRNTEPDFTAAQLQTWHNRIRFLHNQLSAATALYNKIIDNNTPTAEETAQRIAKLF